MLMLLVYLEFYGLCSSQSQLTALVASNFVVDNHDVEIATGRYGGDTSSGSFPKPFRGTVPRLWPAKVLLPHRVFTDAAMSVGSISQGIEMCSPLNMRIMFPYARVVNGCPMPSINKVLWARVAVRQQVMRIAWLHVMPYRMVNGFSTVVQIESIHGWSACGCENRTDWNGLRLMLCL